MFFDVSVFFYTMHRKLKKGFEAQVVLGSNRVKEGAYKCT